jgi:hypothetical protein
MPRLNLYEQQTSAQGPRASGADFGAAPAQALEGAGNEMLKISNRIQEREDLSDRQRLRESFEEAVVPMLNDFGKRQDISSKESIPQFQQALKQKRQELVSKHAGNPESRAKLENQLDNLVSQYTKSAIGTKIKADQELMVRTLNQQFDKSALDTDAAPDIWSFAKDENLMLVEEMRPAMSQDQYVAAKRLAYAKPLQSAVKSHLAQGNWEGAEAIMRDENFSKFLTAQEAIPLRIDIAVGRGKQDAEVKRQDMNVQQFTMRLGRPLTPEETLKARSLPAKKDMTPADEITQLELVQGKPATQDQVDKIFKTYVEGGKSDTMFGKGTQGLAMAYVTEKAVEYANGFLSPAEARRFESSYAEAYMPKNREDPVTGTVQKIAPTVPKFAEEAMRRGSAIYGGLTTGANNLQGDNIRPPGETTTMFIDGKMVGSGVADASGRWSIPAPPESGAAPAPAGGAPAATESPVKGRGLWSMASKVAGPVAGVARWWGGGPVPLGMGQEEVSAAQYVDQQQKSLVRALQQNPRYAEGERKSIEKDIAITPEAMGNPQAYKLRLVEIGKYIDDELRFNAKVLQNPTGTTVQQRQQAMQSNAALSQFYDQLELPPKVKSLAEAQKLPSNVEEFLDENWILRDGPARRRK